MSVINFWTDKERVYRILSLALNVYIAVAAIILGVHLIAPLFGGKLITSALTLYGSWIGMGLIAKYFLKRIQKGLPIEKYEYSLICIYIVACVVLWFPYPIDIFLSVLCIASVVISFRAQTAKKKKD